MKKTALALLVFVFFTVPVFAQDKDKNHTEKDNKIKTELAMNPDQVSKYDALSKEYGGKANALKQDATLTEDQQKQKKMELKKEKEAKVAEFLTPDQLAKYKVLMNKKKDKEKSKNKS